MLKILVCGDRTWTDATLIAQELRMLAFYEDTTDIILIHGDNGYDENDHPLWGKPDELAVRGADKLAGKMGSMLGFQVRIYTPNWRRFPRAAGMIRNSEMLITEKPDFVIAFQDNDDPKSGTSDTIRKAEKLGIPWKRVRHGGE